MAQQTQRALHAISGLATWEMLHGEFGKSKMFPSGRPAGFIGTSIFVVCFAVAIYYVWKTDPEEWG